MADDEVQSLSPTKPSTNSLGLGIPKVGKKVILKASEYPEIVKLFIENDALGKAIANRQREIDFARRENDVRKAEFHLAVSTFWTLCMKHVKGYDERTNWSVDRETMTGRDDQVVIRVVPDPDEAEMRAARKIVRMMQRMPDKPDEDDDEQVPASKQVGHYL